jgi:hypothetical protein
MRQLHSVQKQRILCRKKNLAENNANKFFLAVLKILVFKEKISYTASSSLSSLAI